MKRKILFHVNYNRKRGPHLHYGGHYFNSTGVGGTLRQAGYDALGQIEPRHLEGGREQAIVAAILKLDNVTRKPKGGAYHLTISVPYEVGPYRYVDGRINQGYSEVIYYDNVILALDDEGDEVLETTIPKGDHLSGKRLWKTNA